MSEYGARLADRVRTRGALGPDDAARLLLPVAESLVGVHAATGAHGAVSPSAIHVDGTGRTLLVDPTRAVPDPLFAAPEASTGPTAAADVWSFAAVLHLLTTGRTYQPDEAHGAAVGPRDMGWLTPLVQLALSTDASERPTMADVADYLRARVPAAERSRGPGLVLAVAGAALVVGLGGLGAALLLTTPDDADAPPRADSSTARGPAPADEEPAATASAEKVTAGDLESFARRYVAVASRDPRSGYRMLTRSYQQASPRYQEVWSSIRDPRILAITPDPAALSVSYTYRYSLPDGEQRTEDITLRLVERRGRLLIAGASAR